MFTEVEVSAREWGFEEPSPDDFYIMLLIYKDHTSCQWTDGNASLRVLYNELTDEYQTIDKALDEIGETYSINFNHSDEEISLAKLIHIFYESKVIL